MRHPESGPAPAPLRYPGPRSAERLLRLRRRVAARRRPLAAVAAALAVLSVLRATAEPAVDTVPVVVARTDLPGGTRLTSDDLEVRQIRAPDAPGGALSHPTALLGRLVAAPVRRGEPMTDLRVVSPGLLDGYPGLVAVPVRIADPEAVTLLRVGDHVDLVASSSQPGTESSVAARSAPVVALPPAGSTQSGPLSGAVVVVAVSKEEALVLSGMSVSRIFTLIITA